MIILIHGEDTVASRKALTDEKNKRADFEVIHIDGRKIDLTNLVQATDSNSLFQTKKLIVIEQFFTGPYTKLKEAVLSFITKADPKGADILFWEEKELDKTNIKRLGTKIFELKFQPPQQLFTFLDSLKSQSSHQNLAGFHTVITQKEPELIFVMLLRQFRNLILAKDLGKNGFPPQLAWQYYKLAKQATYFKLEDLILRYRQLLSIDYQIKSGQTPLSLIQLLDIFFVNL